RNLGDGHLELLIRVEVAEIEAETRNEEREHGNDRGQIQLGSEIIHARSVAHHLSRRARRQEADYSWRSAATGSRPAARCAGIQHATAPTMSSSAGTPANTDSESGARTRCRFTMTATIHAISAPAAMTRSVSSTIWPTMRRVLPPSARRTPISVVRCATE